MSSIAVTIENEGTHETAFRGFVSSTAFNAFIYDV